MNSIDKFSTFLINHAELIATDMINFNISKQEIEIPADYIQKAIAVNTEFLEFFSEILACENDREAAEAFKEWSSKKVEKEESSLVGKISSLIKPYADTRLLYNKRIASIIIEQDLSLEDAFKITNRLNHMLDISLTESVLTNEAYTEKINNERQRELNELSAPIVPVQDGVAVLPLIGSFDFDRAEYLLTKIIPRIPDHQIDLLIIDFSGILTIDTEVASHIFAVYDVLRLLGIDVIVTGIRPDLAQKSVSAGIDLSSFKSFANVKQAIKSMK